MGLLAGSWLNEISLASKESCETNNNSASASSATPMTSFQPWCGPDVLLRDMAVTYQF